MLDVVIGSLSSVGGEPEQKVSSYLYDVLKYPRPTHGAGPLIISHIRNIFIYSGYVIL